MADQHRWDFMGYEENGVTHTPYLNQLADDGVALRSAYCTAPLCSPSRAAMTSGRYGMNTGCFTNLHELPPHTPTFIQQFRSAGYRTCAIGKTHMEIHAYDSDLTSARHKAFMDSLGWDEITETSGDDMFRHGIRCAYSVFLEKHNRMNEALEFFEQWRYFMEPEGQGDPSFACNEWTLPEEFHGTAFVGQRSIDWIEQREQDQPFLLHVGFAAPHSPIAPVPEYMDLYRDSAETSPWDNSSPPEWLPDARRGYRAMISHIDAYVGRIRDCIAAQGALENTIFVYMADHGEQAGDHDLYEKTSFFEAAMRVPMILAGPGIQAQLANEAQVETLDIGRTLCDLCSVEPHGFDQGQSLAPLLSGMSTTHRETVYAEMGCDKMLRDERYKLMWGDPRADTRPLGRLHLDKPVNIPPSPIRLFDLWEDPHEQNDLSSQAAYSSIREMMIEKLLVRLNLNTQSQPNKSRGDYRPLSSKRRMSTQMETKTL